LSTRELAARRAARDRLDAAATGFADADEKYRAAKRQRDAAIWRAHVSGLSVRQIAMRVHLEKTRVQEIIQREARVADFEQRLTRR
jgi:hypothetical protein